MEEDEMYPISVTYTPGSGYTGTIPNCSAKIRWGKEFWEEMSAKVKQPSAGDTANTAPASRKELSNDEIAALAGKYNPGKMSQKEFDAFLDELVERGYLTKDETGWLGYGGAVTIPIVDGNISNGCFGGYVTMTDMSKLPGVSPAALPNSLADANGDVLFWAKVRALMEPQSATSEAYFSFAKGTGEAFKALAAVLEAMQAQRK